MGGYTVITVQIILTKIFIFVQKFVVTELVKPSDSFDIIEQGLGREKKFQIFLQIAFIGGDDAKKVPFKNVILIGI